MASFIKKILVFLLLTIVSVVLVMSFINHRLGDKITFKLDSNITSVVFGHSHPETAFNDSLIVNFKNMAQSGESYFYTHIKVRNVLAQNPQIENVFIEFSNIDITQVRDQEIWSDKYINWRYPKYSSLMNIDEHLFLLRKNTAAVLNTSPKVIRQSILRLNRKSYDLLATTSGYMFLTENKIDAIENGTIKMEPLSDEFYEYSEHNLEYLKEIITLCESKNVKVHFVRSPMYKNVDYLKNENLLQRLKDSLFPSIAYIDLVDFDLDKEDFRDLHHVNYKGAAKVSKWFNNHLLNLAIESPISDNNERNK